MTALLFLIVVSGLVSTFSKKVKRWWGSNGYRVRIVRRNLAAASVAALVMLVVTHSPRLAGTKTTSRVTTSSSPTEQDRRQAGKSSGPGFKEVTLPSGKKIKVIAVFKVHFSDDTPALMLKYQTGLKISDLPALRKEVDEIWSVFKGDVENAKLTNAIIGANEAPQGSIIEESKGYNFAFKKVDGAWRLLGDP